jgi:hypothetical protein
LLSDTFIDTFTAGQVRAAAVSSETFPVYAELARFIQPAPNVARPSW